MIRKTQKSVWLLIKRRKKAPLQLPINYPRIEFHKKGLWRLEYHSQREESWTEKRKKVWKSSEIASSLRVTPRRLSAVSLMPTIIFGFHLTLHISLLSDLSAVAALTHKPLDYELQPSPSDKQRNQHNWNFSIRDAEWKEREVVCGKKLKAENLRKIVVAAQPSLVLPTGLRWVLRVQVSIALFFCTATHNVNRWSGF